MNHLKEFVESVLLVIEAAGVGVIVLGIVLGAARYAANVWRAAFKPYRQLRHDVGRGILLGLELLIAADIIRTVAVAPTLENVLVLGLIVLIRTFLSFALQVELEGRWPWQQHARPSMAEEAGHK
jgi:uncharacterized membrane protein